MGINIMDNEKDADIIPFPVTKIERNNPSLISFSGIPIKGVRPIIAFMHHKFNLPIDVSEGDQLTQIKLEIQGEIDIKKAGCKRIKKEINLEVHIDIDDEWETEE